ncbi:hypothetical protein AB1Y20_001417 [Prymnesium parvum]|uniref:Kinesin-like protein n=1 Tax=Prymnesium parvum TaxID=97485 RepID=A0AB34KBZ4_PRYPA
MAPSQHAEGAGPPSGEEANGPSGFWEAHEMQQQLAQFDGNVASDAPMLVAVRLRPLWIKEVEAGDYSVVSVLESKVIVVVDPWYDADLNPNRSKEKKYAFDMVFNEHIGQENVYEETVKGLVNGVLDGYNASVFAYGATGAGKTHTMLGSLESPGVMVNTLHDLYSRMNVFQEAKFKVTLSYMEIYNERIKDLLMPTSIDLQLNEDPVRGMVVQGITEYGADSADEILELLHRGNLYRTVEPTAANQVSSRSHAVLQVTIEQSEATAHVTGNVRVGKLSMVDLAGSERASKTDNTGQRLKEGANINRSLLALGNCITALADKNRKGHVPFRDSKMTRLLKDSLGGNCRTVMIANISPSHRQFEETINTLKYANRAKNLKTKVARNVHSVSAHIAEYQRIIMELRNEVAELKTQMVEGTPHMRHLEEKTPFAMKQRTLDHVDNLEKGHMLNIKNAFIQASSERRRLLHELTELTNRLQQGDVGSPQVTGQPSNAETHSAIADVRRQLQQNQQVFNDIVATTLARISSTERLQLLQLLVRGQFLEFQNEQLETELQMRRFVAQAAMGQGTLPLELSQTAMATEAWYAEHRPAMDFHAKMVRTEMGGSLRAPSIAQLLDQNLLSPQQAAASQNLGELVRPFQTSPRESTSLPLSDAAARRARYDGAANHGGNGLQQQLSRRASSAEDISERSNGSRGSCFGNSQNSFSRGRRRNSALQGAAPPGALHALRVRQSSDTRHVPLQLQRPQHKSTCHSKGQAGAHAARRLHGHQQGGARHQNNSQMPAINVIGVGSGQSSQLQFLPPPPPPPPMSPAQISSQRAAANVGVRQPQRMQALNAAYGVPTTNRPPSLSGRTPSALPTGHRQRKIGAVGRTGLPPAAPSQARAQQLRFQHLQAQGLGPPPPATQGATTA